MISRSTLVDMSDEHIEAMDKLNRALESSDGCSPFFRKRMLNYVDASITGMAVTSPILDDDAWN
ncbi:hypothetical protein Patl1_14131 [Pistacia atlantica]|uniref:Uncharacterized protein n=1 Tax=Pistacia atlantica TaxID=434234 RepID=A0ACC1AVN0_9ROSI|nr:hypothetical protein Patl1_14131 [Pistacia atlantica]